MYDKSLVHINIVSSFFNNSNNVIRIFLILSRIFKSNKLILLLISNGSNNTFESFTLIVVFIPFLLECVIIYSINGN